MDNTFVGFPREFTDFLFELQFENTYEKKAENAEKYKRLITEPQKLLYKALLPVISEMDADIDTRPVVCISSPYNDARFSPAEPLKNYMYLKFRQSGRTSDIAGLYFDMGCDSYSYGIRFYKKTTQGMKARRDKIAENPKKITDEIKKVLDGKFMIYGEKYKKDHYPEITDKFTKEILNYKYFCIGTDVPINEAVFTEKLADEISEGFAKLGKLLKMMML